MCWCHFQHGADCGRKRWGDNELNLRHGTFEMPITHLNGGSLRLGPELLAFKTMMLNEITAGVRGLRSHLMPSNT